MRKLPFLASIVIGTATWGAIVVAGGIQIVDDGDASFSITGFWTSISAGYQTDALTATTGTSALAVWNFADQPAGTYRVSATWPTGTSATLYATNAPFKVYRGTTLLFTRTINQRNAPDDFTDAGVEWEDLSSNDHAVILTGTSSITVTLGNASADGTVVADAVRIDRQ